MNHPRLVGFWLVLMGALFLVNAALLFVNDLIVGPWWILLGAMVAIAASFLKTGVSLLTTKSKLPADVEITHVNDQAFCIIAQGSTVGDTIFPSGYKSPPCTDEYVWVIRGTTLKATPR